MTQDTRLLWVNHDCTNLKLNFKAVVSLSCVRGNRVMDCSTESMHEALTEGRPADGSVVHQDVERKVLLFECSDEVFGGLEGGQIKPHELHSNLLVRLQLALRLLLHALHCLSRTYFRPSSELLATHSSGSLLRPARYYSMRPHDSKGFGDFKAYSSVGSSHHSYLAREVHGRVGQGATHRYNCSLRGQMTRFDVIPLSLLVRIVNIG